MLSCENTYFYYNKSVNKIITVNNETNTLIKEQDVKILVEGFGNYQLKGKKF